jgi:hypothetical protein
MEGSAYPAVKYTVIKKEVAYVVMAIPTLRHTQSVVNEGEVTIAI